MRFTDHCDFFNVSKVFKENDFLQLWVNDLGTIATIYPQL